MILSILVCTTHDRKDMFDKLHEELNRQRWASGMDSEVEILYECDNKEISVGAKRQLLIERATGEFVVFIDSDDWVSTNFILCNQAAGC